MIVRYGDHEVSCLVRQTAAVTGRIRIHVYPNGDVEIEAPEDKEVDHIRAAAQRRARWIFQHRNAAIAARRMALPREYISGETHFYLGRRHKLIIHESKSQRSEVKLLRGKLEVSLPVADRAAVRRRLNAWYSDRATEYLSKKVGEISERLSWTSAPPPFKLMRMRTQWGSCSPEGVIYLNPALIRAPRHCIEYVILHELCHLIEHNHSKRFFDLLTKHMLDWQSAKRELDSLAELILAGNE
ncbi:SprT family zinc-dependent metalloprotease [Sphingomonas paucimobilis]|uniref:M48 family metallopeptidase n=1 Tax=Sphingomonas paucimobilis TaxID=13689 RepID=UPI0028D3278D|nr:SprT family zinc-dependent metalloprotease [Sphingomonas paucimobilis]